GLARFGQEGTTGLESAAIAIDAVAGQAADADRRLADASASPASQHWLPRLHLATARILAMTERGEIGEPFDQAVADLDSIVDALPADGIRWRRPIRQLLCRPDQPVLVFVAFGRLAQAAGCGLPRTRQLATAKQAIRRLGRYANTPLLRANHQLALAWLAQLEGNQRRALRHCSRAESWLRAEYAPLAAFEVARLRARVLTDLGQLAAATDQARSALALADAYRWGARRRRISVSFDLSGLTSYHHGPYGPSGPSGTGGDGGSDPSLAGRRLAALQQVSLATCRVLDPDDLVRVTLDETIRIMSAERALLFLSDHHHLRPHLGRDAAGHDLQDVTGFSATLVDHVRDSGEVLVVTGSEEGLALGSASMAAYGLRSIMIAPLSLEGRFLGAVYLDSRVAKGIFTTDDAALLAAIVGHIALALETTRTIQLEQAIHSERERRDIAERLHHAMTALAEPSSPTTVLHRLLEQLLRLLPGEQGWLLCQEGDHFQIVAHRSTQLPSPEAPDPGSLVPADELLTTVLNADQVAQGTAAQASPGGLVGDDRPWIALPVTAGTGQRGVVVLAGAERQTYHRPQIAVAVVLARHGMTAYDNACLINQLRQLATVDELTGAANRHDFFTRATVLFDHAHQQQRPLTVMMIDLDHFKQVNDTYGHQTGDQVLLVTAQRLRSAVRTTDLLCRYGGEEFALVLPNADPADGVVAERIRHSFSAAPIDTDAGPVLITVSIGVTNLAASDHDLRTVLARADTALYQAKASGRNCIVTIREE
ncbi:MAG: sensor domain-containing diguanylate cyclase, partial [Micromonosporaceae bacterium]|nr:sensor domain-containing diguanylate cyclase [Micromonosporaceae bacterium]